MERVKSAYVFQDGRLHKTVESVDVNPKSELETKGRLDLGAKVRLSHLQGTQ